MIPKAAEVSQIEHNIQFVDPKVRNPNSFWRVLFDIYNKYNEEKLGMSCAPCYVKVYNWAKTVVEFHARHKTSN